MEKWKKLKIAQKKRILHEMSEADGLKGIHWEYKLRQSPTPDMDGTRRRQMRQKQINRMFKYSGIAFAGPLLWQAEMMAMACGLMLKTHEKMFEATRKLMEGLEK